jgi:F0F1-type ATP synthase alpha subunit
MIQECQNECIIFSANTKLDAEKYFAPFAALAYANTLKSLGNDVILVFDDIVHHYTKEILIFNTVNQPFVYFF